MYRCTVPTKSLCTPKNTNSERSRHQHQHTGFIVEISMSKCTDSSVVLVFACSLCSTKARIPAWIVKNISFAKIMDILS